MKANLQELEDYKEDLKNHHLENDHIKFGSIQRELSEKEKVLWHKEKERIEYENLAKDFERGIMEKEEIVLNQKQFIESQKLEIDKLRTIIRE
jgi:hypothetical protein